MREIQNKAISAAVTGLTLLALSVAAQAEGTSTTVSAAAPASEGATSKARLPAAAAPRGDIDEEITNARLRASTGAKRVVSVQSSFNYNGGSIGSPLSNKRPELGAAVTESEVKLSGNVSVKYRMTDHDNLNVGSGVAWVTPLYDGQKTQVENPYVSYGRTFKSGDVQNVLTLQAMAYTAQSSTNKAMMGESLVQHTILFSIPESKWQLGLVGAWTREFYTSANGRYQDTIAALPFAEYEFNPTFSFRTVYRGFTYFNTNTRGDTFAHDDSTQSLGVGIALTRDIYLYPNIQWAWENIRSDVTNVALNAYINL